MYIFNAKLDIIVGNPFVYLPSIILNKVFRQARIGEEIEVEIEFDPSDRTIEPHPKFSKALLDNKEANDVFENLSPSKQKEIVRYISNLKTEKSVEKNVTRAINFLLGKERFVGRDKP